MSDKTIKGMSVTIEGKMYFCCIALNIGLEQILHKSADESWSENSELIKSDCKDRENPKEATDYFLRQYRELIYSKEKTWGVKEEIKEPKFRVEMIGYMSLILLVIALTSSCKRTYLVHSSSYPKPLIKTKQTYAQGGYKYVRSEYVNDSTVFLIFKK